MRAAMGPIGLALWSLVLAASVHAQTPGNTPRIYTCVTPEGRLLVTTPNACSLLTLEKWLAGHVLLMDPAHVREFTPSDLQRVASECGLAAQSMITVNSWEAQYRRSVTWLSKLLQLAPEVGSIERGDNIVAVFVRA